MRQAAMGFEPMINGFAIREDDFQETQSQALTNDQSSACTPACMENAGTHHGTSDQAPAGGLVDALLAVLQNLRAEDRRRLADLLNGSAGEAK